MKKCLVFLAILFWVALATPAMAEIEEIERSLPPLPTTTTVRPEGPKSIPQTARATISVQMDRRQPWIPMELQNKLANANWRAVDGNEGEYFIRYSITTLNSRNRGSRGFRIGDYSTSNKNRVRSATARVNIQIIGPNRILFWSSRVDGQAVDLSGHTDLRGAYRNNKRRRNSRVHWGGYSSPDRRGLREEAIRNAISKIVFPAAPAATPGFESWQPSRCRDYYNRSRYKR